MQSFRFRSLFGQSVIVTGTPFFVPDAGDALGAASSEPPADQRAPASAVSGLTDAEQAVLAAIDHEEESIETIADDF